MAFQILYFLLAMFALGLLIFIHELGHYFMARHVGMTVEAFAIGFGKPLISWERKGVKWQLCVLPFGGYVRIKGMDKGKDERKDLHEIPDGYFGKKPLDRIKVALMGPVVNIVFAFLAFSAIWISGGRNKPFQEYNSIAGWIDPSSELYEKGIRPGDVITKYDGRDFEGMNSLKYAALTSSSEGNVKGFKVDYSANTETPFDYTVETYPFPNSIDSNIRTFGMLTPARYLIYNTLPDGVENPIAANSPMVNSGIEYGDRILWANGELIFSADQLNNILNSDQVHVTFERSGQRYQTRLPRIALNDLRLAPNERGELEDQALYANLNSATFATIPYQISNDLVVDRSIVYIDDIAEEHTFSSPDQIAMQPGDRIIAVNGASIAHPKELLSHMQNKQVQIIVQRQKERPILSWKTVNSQFNHEIDWNEFQQLAAAVGDPSAPRQLGNLALLKPVTPVPLQSILTEEQNQKMAQQQSELEAIENPAEQALALKAFNEGKNRLVLNIQLQDRVVKYNPTPLVLFSNVLSDMAHTLKSLFTGNLHPKWMSGPVGIMQVLHHGWSIGINEALYYIALISLNLGVLNLLPLPVLDGGHICFALYEQFTRKKVKAKVMERLVVAFFILLVSLGLYVTYQDIFRLVKTLF